MEGKVMLGYIRLGLIKLFIVFLLAPRTKVNVLIL